MDLWKLKKPCGCGPCLRVWWHSISGAINLKMLADTLRHMLWQPVAGAMNCQSIAAGFCSICLCCSCQHLLCPFDTISGLVGIWVCFVCPLWLSGQELLSVAATKSHISAVCAQTWHICLASMWVLLNSAQESVTVYSCSMDGQNPHVCLRCRRLRWSWWWAWR